MKQWYPQYWAQTWYRNTFLVRHPHDIGQAIDHDHEWNSIYDSGCNFTCLAMIVGIDPGRLASALSSQKVFRADRSIRARYLDGRKRGLVWDRNAPCRPGQSISTSPLWHHGRNRMATVGIELIDITATRELQEGNRIVKAARAKKLHVICGSTDHSHLVAGTKDGQYFVWDPDDSERQLAQILKGDIRLGHIFKEYPREAIEFWSYRVEFA